VILVDMEYVIIVHLTIFIVKNAMMKWRRMKMPRPILRETLFVANCPYCNSGHWHAITTEFDDIYTYVLAKCDECERKFDIDYVCVRISPIKEQ